MIFPEYSVDIGAEAQEGAAARGKTLDFDFLRGDFAVRDGRLQPLEGEAGLQVWIEKCIRTEAEKYRIYRQDGYPYGLRTFDLTNRRLPQAFLRAEIEREITEALLRNTGVLAVRGFSFGREGRKLMVGFTVESVYGEKEVGYEWLIA